MSANFSASDGDNNLSEGHRNDVILFELSNNEIGAKIYNLTNELNSRGIMFSIWITKKKKYLIIYKINQVSPNKETRENLLKHLVSTYSLKIERNIENAQTNLEIAQDLEDVKKVNSIENAIEFGHMQIKNMINIQAEAMRLEINLVLDLIFDREYTLSQL